MKYFLQEEEERGGDVGRGGGVGYSVSSESVKTIKRASNRGSIVQWELLWGNKRSIGFIALEHQPTAQAPGENTKQEIEIPRETKSDTITYTHK